MTYTCPRHTLALVQQLGDWIKLCWYVALYTKWPQAVEFSVSFFVFFSFLFLLVLSTVIRLLIVISHLATDLSVIALSPALWLQLIAGGLGTHKVKLASIEYAIKEHWPLECRLWPFISLYFFAVFFIGCVFEKWETNKLDLCYLTLF